jgi:type III secretion protein L
MLYLKNEPGVQLHPQGKVIKAAQYALWADVQAVIAAAQQEAKRIVSGAQAAYEAERQKGFEKGVQEGSIQISEHMMDTIAKSVQSLGSFEQQIIDLVMKALTRILGEMEDKDRVTRVVRQSLNLVRNQKRVTLKVNPLDARYLEGAISDIIKDYPGIGYIDVVADARVPAGSCMLESDIGVVDARLDIQLEAIRRSLQKSIK